MAVNQVLKLKFLDAGIQDVSTSISIEFKIEYLDELIEMSVDEESDTHVEARDRRYSCLTYGFRKLVNTFNQFLPEKLGFLQRNNFCFVSINVWCTFDRASLVLMMILLLFTSNLPTTLIDTSKNLHVFWN